MSELSNSDKYVPALAYKPLTRFYDLIVGLTTRERTFKQALITQAHVEPHSAVLDVACGTGTLAILLKAQHPDAQVTGIDGDPDILEIARQKSIKTGMDITLDHGLSFELPYDDSAFNTVVSSLFFHHLSRKNKARTAVEIHRVLKPGGAMHVADWGKPDNLIMGMLYYAIQVLDGFENTNNNRRGLLPAIFENAGFADVSLRQTISTVFGTMALYSGQKYN